MEQYSAPTTTADSQADGRLKVAAGCSHGKKKCVKCVMKSHKDGKGGPGFTNLGAPGYGATKLQKSLSMPASIAKTKGKAKKIKNPVSAISSSIKSLNKNMNFGKVVKNSKAGSLKSMLKKFKVKK